jgi:hypothetical protein
MQSKSPKPEITGPMLFSRNALTSGLQDCFFAEKKITKLKRGQGLQAMNIDIISGNQEGQAFSPVRGLVRPGIIRQRGEEEV